MQSQGRLPYFRHVDEARNVAVRQGGENVSGFEPFEALHDIRPRLQAMPCASEARPVALAELLESILARQFIDLFSVDPFDVRPRPATFAHGVHAGLVCFLPVVNESRPVDGKTFLGPEFLELFDEAAAPIDDRAKDIEDQRFHCHLHVS